MLCLKESDGAILWKHEYDCPYRIAYPAGPRATPTVHQGKVYTLGAQGDLFCLAAENGKVLWSCDFKKAFGLRVPTWGVSAPPLIEGDQLICIVGGDGTTVVAFNKDTGVAGTINTPFVEDGYIHLKRRWQAGDIVQLDLALSINRLYAHEKIAADRGKVSLMRGPITYCIEAADNTAIISVVSFNYAV